MFLFYLLKNTAVIVNAGSVGSRYVIQKYIIQVIHKAANYKGIKVIRYQGEA